MTHLEIAIKLARGIFEVGDEPHDKVQRIEFKGGRYTPGNEAGTETSLGGLCESALAGVLARMLAQLSDNGNGNAHE